jgi:HD-like signal output (HDOD) protein
MLGINTVKNLALSTAVLGTLPNNKNPGGLNMEGFWRHSLCVGVTAKMLAKKRGVEQNRIEEHFTAGLLHDIGKIPMNASLASGYLETVSHADRAQMPLYAAEDARLGMNHCAAGEIIVKAWKLDGVVADAIVFHHRLDEYDGPNYETLCDVAVANYFASTKEIGFAGDRNPDKPGEKAWLSLGINEDTLEEIGEAVNVEIEKAKVFLST